MKTTIEYRKTPREDEAQLVSWMLGYLEACTQGGAPDDVRERLLSMIATREKQAVIEI